MIFFWNLIIGLASHQAFPSYYTCFTLHEVEMLIPSFSYANNGLWIIPLSVSFLQYSWAWQVILEGIELCQAPVDEQARAEGWGCRNRGTIWAWVLRLVLRRWDCGEGIRLHWLLCLIFREMGIYKLRSLDTSKSSIRLLICNFFFLCSRGFMLRIFVAEICSVLLTSIHQ